MKKLINLLIIPICFLCITHSVSADTKPCTVCDQIVTYDITELEEIYMERFDSDRLNNIISEILSYYDFYKDSYPYYVIRSVNPLSDTPEFQLVVFDKKPGFSTSDTFYNDYSGFILSFEYSYVDSLLTKFDTSDLHNFHLFTSTIFSVHPEYFYPFLTGNFKFIVNDISYLNNLNGYYYDGAYKEIRVPIPRDPNKYSVLSVNNKNNNYTLPFLLDYFYPDIAYKDYTEINLNDYPYIALSLKDYSVKSFTTPIIVKGQFCPTAVYNFGLSSKDSVTGSQITDRCSLPYNDFTNIRLTISSLDISNNVVYYIKAYDNSIDNIIRIDSRVFDVSYITNATASNPTITVNGNSYSSIPYDKLPSSATNNEANDYIPGDSERMDVEDIFSRPLEFFKNISEAITSVFSLVGKLFTFLPTPLYNFLLFSFVTSIVLGIIKKIL